MFSPAAWLRLLTAGRTAALTGLLTLAAPLHGELLYSTDFESFTAGPDNWAGTEGWNATETGDGTHGIDQDILIPFGKTAFLGSREPSSTFVSVYKSFNYDPSAHGNVGVYIDSVIGIEDSTNGNFDHFYLSFYNSTGQYLASILFSNHPTTYGVWRLDGTNQTDTTVDFITGEVHLITIDLDLANNMWSAAMDGIPLFSKETFTTTGNTRDFGPVAYEWLLSASTTTNFGDNWMLIADFQAYGVPPGEGPFVFDTFGIGPGGSPNFTFTGEPGWDYQVEYSQNAADWFDDLAGSFYTGITEPTQVNFLDPTPEIPPGRFYRVIRSITP